MYPKRHRFWAWLMVGLLVFVNTSSSLANAELAEIPTPTPSPALEIQATTDIVINEIRGAAAGSNLEFVELYNTGATTADLSGWQIRSASATLHTFAANTTITSKNWLSVNLVNALADSGDTVTLLTNTGLQIDQIRYGLGADAQLPAANTNLSIGRRADGSANWYAQLTATPGLANGSAVTLQKPNAPFVRAGTSSAAHIINLATKSGVQVETSVPVSSLATDQIIFDLLDANGTLKFVTANALAGSGQIVSPAIDTTTAPAQVDGSISVRTFAKTSDGVETAYASGTAALRDTVAPAGPSALSIAATSLNPTHTINLASVANVKTSISVPSTTLASDIVSLELSDGKQTIKEEGTNLASGGTFIFEDRAGLAGLQTQTLSDGPIALRATVRDAAGNSAPSFTGTQATKDTAPPSGSLLINRGATVTASSTVTLTITASDVGSGVTEMRLANTNDFAGTSFEPFVGTKTWNLISGNGPRTVYLQIRDAAGNVSVATNRSSHAEALIWLAADAQEITLTNLTAGTQTVRHLPVELDLSATGETVLTTARYGSNPGSTLPTGTLAFGSFREIGVADPAKISFPVTVKIYYTTTDLGAAGVTNENQLIGIAFSDLATNRWKTYETTGVITTDQVVNGVTYAGYLFATATHLTPMVALADTAAPPAPANLTATASAKTVHLAWQGVSEAASYAVRYRRADTNDPSTEVSLSKDLTSVKITNLANGTSYEFGVASRDASGNLSAFTTVTATPTGPERAVTEPTERLVVLAPISKIQPPAQPVAKPSPTPMVTSSPSPDTETPVDRRDVSRLLMIIALLLIGAGALLAGFYGYQWWLTRPVAPDSGPLPPPALQPPTPPATPEPPREEPPPTGRW